MQPYIPVKRLCAALALGLWVATPALAINDDPATALLPTSFGNPGARAAGMGGAFLGLSDDSSAVFLNPAGILLLPQREVTVELRNRRNEPIFLESNPGDLADRNDSAETSVSFVSLALPLVDSRFAFGFFYGDFSNYSFDARSSRFSRTVFGQPVTFNPQFVSVDLEDRYYGGSMGVEVSENLRLGAAVFGTRRDLRALTELNIGSDAAPNLRRQISEVDDSDVGFTIGAHWKASDALRFGLSYRSQLDYELNITGSSDARGAISVLPATLTIGAAYAINDRLQLALDLQRVYFGDIIADKGQFVSGANAVAANAGLLFEARNLLAASDGTNVRVGMEYAIPGANGSWLVRGGYWREADFSLAVPQSLSDVRLEQQGALRLASTWFPRGEGQNHFTAGLGFAGQNYGLDFALDYSKRNVELVGNVRFYF